MLPSRLGLAIGAVPFWRAETLDERWIDPSSWEGELSMARIGPIGRGWFRTAARLLPPLLEMAGLGWAKHRQDRTRQENEHLASEVEALSGCLGERDSEVARLRQRLAACEEGLAEARGAIEQLEQELTAEKSKPWWEKLFRSVGLRP